MFTEKKKKSARDHFQAYTMNYSISLPRKWASGTTKAGIPQFLLLRVIEIVEFLVLPRLKTKIAHTSKKLFHSVL
jgi:hypothetical protein